MNNFKAFTAKLFIYLFLFICAFPLAVLFLWSIAKRWPWPYLLPQEYSLRGILYMLGPSGGCAAVLCFSVMLSIGITIIVLLLSIPAGKALGIYNFKGKSFFKLLLISPIIIPTTAIAMGVHVFFLKLGLANTLAGVILIHILPCLPYGVLIFSDIYELIGEKMELQARVLGANDLQTFLHVTLPIIAPGIVSAGSMIFIVSFSQYFLTFLIGGGNIMTFSIMMFPFIQSGDRAMASSYSIVFIAVSLMLFILVEKLVKSYYKTNKYFYI